MKNEWARKMTYEAITILGVLALLTFICRLWPLLLLVILCLIGAAIRLLFLKAKSTSEVAPTRPAEPEPSRPATEKDVKDLAFSIILTRITEAVKTDFPNAKWVWEKPNAKSLVLSGDEAFIILSGAGGYRRAKVVIENLQFVSLAYVTAPEKATDADTDATDNEEMTEESGESDVPVNYDLMAFEWTEAHIIDLNEKCNEAIGQGKDSLVISAEELPAPESWDAICSELVRAGLENIEKVPEGIKIKFMC